MLRSTRGARGDPCLYSTNDRIERDGALGRWRLRVGEDGKPVGTPELLPMAGIDDGGQLAKASSGRKGRQQIGWA